MSTDTLTSVRATLAAITADGDLYEQLLDAVALADLADTAGASLTRAQCAGPDAVPAWVERAEDEAAGALDALAVEIAGRIAVAA